MNKIASWIVASSPARHHLLGAALALMNVATVPPGWTTEIVVGIESGDEIARAICEAAGAIVVEVRMSGGGPKRNAAVASSRGSLLLIADDDDMPAPSRIVYATRAHAKAAVTSTREFRYLHLDSGAVVRWKGRAADNGGVPEPVVGTARNIDRGIFVRARGYGNLPRQLDSELQRRMIHTHRIQDIELSSLRVLGDCSPMWRDTICVQHGANVWNDRPAIGKGETFRRGSYLLVGEGHWSELADFPPAVAAALELR